MTRSAGKVPYQPRVDGAEREFATERTIARTRYVVEQPLQLRTGKVGVDDEAGLALDPLRMAGAAQRIRANPPRTSPYGS